MMHGVDQNAPLLMSILGLDVEGGTPTGRFRDIHVNEDGSRIVLLTRNGGGNREHWDFSYENPEGEGCACPGCIQSYVLPKHPNYVRDWDDDFDSTFAHTEFSVPEEYLAITRSIATGEPPATLLEKTEAAFARLKEMSPEELKADPRFGPLLSAFERILPKQD
jgi:hypothetical protein